MRYALFVAAAVMAASALVTAPALAYDGGAPGQASLAANVRSGPSDKYEIIGKVSNGQKLQIIGCTRSWEWCDVKTNDKRGWIAARFLLGRYENNLAGVINYGKKIGIEEIVFEERAYWGEHYSQTHFYKKRYGMQQHHATAPVNDRSGDSNWDQDRYPHQQRGSGNSRWSWTDPTITPSNKVYINN